MAPMRRALLASATALALLAASSPVRAQLSQGELVEVVEGFAGDLFEFLLQVLLSPADVPLLEVPIPLPEPVTTHVLGYPITPDEISVYAAARVADRVARVTVMDEITAMAGTAATVNELALEALAVLNALPQPSVAAATQLGTAAEIAGNTARVTMSQTVATQAALDADLAWQQEQSRAIAVAQDKYFVGYDSLAGGVELVPGHVPLPW